MVKIDFEIHAPLPGCSAAARDASSPPPRRIDSLRVRCHARSAPDLGDHSIRYRCFFNRLFLFRRRFFGSRLSRSNLLVISFFSSFLTTTHCYGGQRLVFKIHLHRSFLIPFASNFKCPTAAPLNRFCERTRRFP